jgi:Ca-activated chloride channel homolog
MKYRLFTPATFILFTALCMSAQSGRPAGYSESVTTRMLQPAENVTKQAQKLNAASSDTDVERVPTDLVTIPVRVATNNGKAVRGIARNEFRVYENDVEQELAYFSSDEQPFTVALVLDMSYSTVFKLEEIRTAARIFTLKLRPQDRVSVIAFDEKPQVLCEPTNDRRVLQLAIEGAKIGSGTALYDTLQTALDQKLVDVPGRRAIVMLTDGVDTSSKGADARSIADRLGIEDVIVYTLQYNTFEDVTRNREKNAEMRFDDDDRPYVVQRPPEKGERVQDYSLADDFLKSLSQQTGGRVYRVSSTTNLNDAFSSIADELRRTYSLGYYPKEDRNPGKVYGIKVRVYRPNLKITARNRYTGK